MPVTAKSLKAFSLNIGWVGLFRSEFQFIYGSVECVELAPSHPCIASDHSFWTGSMQHYLVVFGYDNHYETDNSVCKFVVLFQPHDTISKSPTSAMSSVLFRKQQVMICLVLVNTLSEVNQFVLLKLKNYLLLDWSTNTKSSIAYTKLLIMIEFQEPCEIISVFSPASPFFFPRFLLCPLSLIPDVFLYSIILHQRLMPFQVTC